MKNEKVKRSSGHQGLYLSNRNLMTETIKQLVLILYNSSVKAERAKQQSTEKREYHPGIRNSYGIAVIKRSVYTENVKLFFCQTAANITYQPVKLVLIQPQQ